SMRNDMALTSKHFLGEKADGVRTRLELCLKLNPKHFLPGTKGPEVARIQGALGTLGNVKISERELADKFYGDTTVAAVLAFKRQWNILNYENKLDPIVGIKTLGRLDEMMRDLEKRHTPPLPPPPPPIVDVAGVQIGPMDHRRHVVDSYYHNCGLETIEWG